MRSIGAGGVSCLGMGVRRRWRSPGPAWRGPPVSSDGSTSSCGVTDWLSPVRVALVLFHALRSLIDALTVCPVPLFLAYLLSLSPGCFWVRSTPHPESCARFPEGVDPSSVFRANSSLLSAFCSWSWRCRRIALRMGTRLRLVGPVTLPGSSAGDPPCPRLLPDADFLARRGARAGATTGERPGLGGQKWADWEPAGSKRGDKWPRIYIYSRELVYSRRPATQIRMPPAHTTQRARVPRGAACSSLRRSAGANLRSRTPSEGHVRYRDRFWRRFSACTSAQIASAIGAPVRRTLDRVVQPRGLVGTPEFDGV